jgi:hypothetical protein
MICFIVPAPASGVPSDDPCATDYALDVMIQRSHHAYPGEHRWPVMFSNQQ